MKRLTFLAFALLMFCTPLSAQNWLDALKGVATSAIEEIAGGEITALRIVGTWQYTQPGIKLSSEDTLSELSAAAATTTIQKQLDTYYQKVGIRQGACSFTFNEDGSFSSQFGQRTLSGTYTFDTESFQLSLHFENGLFKLGTIPAYAYMNGENLQVVFPVDKLVNMLVAFGSKSSRLAPITSLIQQYDSIKLGFEFKK